MSELEYSVELKLTCVHWISHRALQYLLRLVHQLIILCWLWLGGWERESETYCHEMTVWRWETILHRRVLLVSRHCNIIIKLTLLVHGCFQCWIQPLALKSSCYNKSQPLFLVKSIFHRFQADNIMSTFGWELCKSLDKNNHKDSSNLSLR